MQATSGHTRQRCPELGRGRRRGRVAESRMRTHRLARADPDEWDCPIARHSTQTDPHAVRPRAPTHRRPGHDRRRQQSAAAEPSSQTPAATKACIGTRPAAARLILANAFADASGPRSVTCTRSDRRPSPDAERPLLVGFRRSRRLRAGGSGLQAGAVFGRPGRCLTSPLVLLDVHHSHRLRIGHQ